LIGRLGNPCAHAEADNGPAVSAANIVAANIV
jgi:hypothetical protein